MSATNPTRWLIGVTGGIAAYKIPHLCRLLKKSGKDVKVMLSQNAQHFVTPLALQAVTSSPVYSAMMDPEFENQMGHIELARWAQGILIAPLSANRLAALALGMADDLITTVCLATQAPIYVAPGMNEKMWAHPATQQHIATLKQRGITVLGPDWGEQACGDIGWGRMQEPEAIVAQLFKAAPETTKRLQGLNVLITAGPTIEPLDPVRYISNRSSGKMGFALAQAAQNLGAKVTLVSGPVNLPTPKGVHRIDVTSTQAMFDAVFTQVEQADIFIGAAAVADYRVATTSTQKIKHHRQPEFTLNLIQNPDILAEVASRKQRPFCVGFAAETEQGEAHALEKLSRKNLDLVALNDVSRKDIGFDVDENEITVFSANSKTTLVKAPKTQIAYQLMEIIGEHYDAKYKTKNIG